jgi:glycosyltransferase involved in cell wall biosynthesis
VIVVDNGSTDGSADVAREAGARVLSAPGVRVGELRNRGAAAARGEILAFIDADHVIERGWIRGAVNGLADPLTGAVGETYHAPEPGTWVQTAYDRLRRHIPGRRVVSWLPSGNMAIRRELFERLNGFDRSLVACEDVDLCQRVGHAGFAVVSDDALHSTHYGDPPTLRALFVGELWRGRDNVRASLRGPLSMRELPSLLAPLLGAASIVSGVGGLILSPAGLPVTAAACC